jgi:peptide chain release factor 2
MRERDALEDQLAAIGRIEQELDDQLTMIELGESEKDDKTVAEAEAALKRLKAEVARRELEALLSGEADANDCYLEVHAGAGGTESQDWAGMLMRMYVRWAEAHGYKVEWIEESEGESAGIWLAQERERRAPAGAHLAVRRQCAAAYLVRQRQRLPGARRQHQDRHQ